MSKQVSAIDRLQSLPRVFRGADLTVRFQWTSKTASQYLYLWKKRGLVDGLGGHSDVFANLLVDRHADWATALSMAMPSAVIMGIEALRLAGWTTQIPRVPTVAVDRHQPIFSTPHFELSRRDPAWFVAVRPGLLMGGALPVLGPPWALADMLNAHGWGHCGLDQEDIDGSAVTENDRAQWTEACVALGLPASPLDEQLVAHQPGQ